MSCCRSIEADEPSFFSPRTVDATPAIRLAYFKACTIAHPRLQAADQALRRQLVSRRGPCSSSSMARPGWARPRWSGAAASGSLKNAGKKWNMIRAGCRSSGWK